MSKDASDPKLTHETVSAPRVRLVLPDTANDRLRRVASIFAEQVERRCSERVVMEGRAQLEVVLTIAPGIGEEGFRISDRVDGGIEVAGQTEIGVLYGLGKLLRTSGYSDDGFAPGTWRGQSIPQKHLRGIYFATHFHNYYHDAPVNEVKRYVGELALWGFNTLVIWYDMHHFDGFDDPDAQAMRNRLYAMCEAAKGIGLKIGLINVANEAYRDSPEELRVGEDVKRGGWYDCAVCPEKTDRRGLSGLDYILSILGEEYEWISPLSPEYVVIWPYDQGGCGCEKCRPWGSNGFVRTGDAVAALAREKLPEVKIIASTWFLDDDEWAGMRKSFREENPWADIILAEGKVRRIEGFPMAGFPEISMTGMFPWGGFGASILASRAEGLWNGVKAESTGGFPYSEGIYEDITKVVYAQLYWNDRPWVDTVKEYVAYEFSQHHTDQLFKVIATLESNHHFRWWPDQYVGPMNGTAFPEEWIPNRGAKPEPDHAAEDAWNTVQQVHEMLPEWAQNSWRWRILFLRAFLDSELKTNGGEPNARCYEAFEELVRIYHAQYADAPVRPPVPPAFDKEIPFADSTDGE